MAFATDYRPRSFDQILGQENLVGQHGILTRMIRDKNIKSVIFYGPPGSGKTTSARILAEESGMQIEYMNGVTFSVTDVKKAVKEHNDPFLLYLDEIQYLSVKQQQVLLPFIESGELILIASTTDNPYFQVHEAVLSRCLVLEFKPINHELIKDRLKAIISDSGRLNDIDDETLTAIAKMSSGDVRRSINTLEMVLDHFQQGQSIQIKDLEKLMPQASMAGFDKDGDYHYMYVSAMQKSIRGSDPDAAIFWMSKLLEAGDIKSPARRLLVIASEDIGLANPDALGQVLACIQAAERLGVPEAFYPMSQAVLLLALSPKSNSIGNAFNKARNDIRNGYGTSVPAHIAQEHPKGYIYPHDYPHHWVQQQYLPDDLIHQKYYTPSDNQLEQGLKNYWDFIKQ